MRSTHLVPLAPFALVFGLVTACGGSSSTGLMDNGAGGQDGQAGQSGGGSQQPMVSVDDLATKYATAYCEAFTNCIGGLIAIFRPGEDCVIRTTQTLKEELATLPNAVERGTVKYDQSKLQGCIDEISSRDCSILSDRLPASCKAALAGTIAQGGECSLDSECKGEQYCKLGDTCPGKCAPYEQAGGACTGDGDCVSGLKCGVTAHCVAPSQEGEACKEGEPDCVDGFVCLGEDSTAHTPGKCVTLSQGFSGKLGGACAFGTNLCVPGLACEIKSVTPLSGECVAKLGTGAVCHVAIPDECQDDEYCVLPTPLGAGKCTPKPAPGAKCGAGLGDGKVCRAYARCDTDVCRDIAHAGEQCNANDTCYSGHCLNNACVTGDSCE